MTEQVMRQEVKAILKRHMNAKGWNSLDLALAMGEGGEASVRNKISRGSFSAAWFLRALSVMDVQQITVEIPAAMPEPPRIVSDRQREWLRRRVEKGA